MYEVFDLEPHEVTKMHVLYRRCKNGKTPTVNGGIILNDC